MKKYSNLSEEILAEAYNILYHANDRPAYAKVKRVREILAGEITPGCQAATWREFFDFLDASQAPAPLSPAEWLADTDPELVKWINDNGALTMYDVENLLGGYAAHVKSV